MTETLKEKTTIIKYTTMLAIIVSVATSVAYMFNVKADFTQKDLALDTRIQLLEKEAETRRNYMINMKSELKKDISGVEEKVDNIYMLLLKK